MKNINDYINESLLINEELESVWKKTKETVTIQDKIQNFFASLRGKKISLSNAQELRKVFKDFIHTFTFGTDMQNRQILKKYGLATEEGFKNFVLNSHDEFEKNKFYIDWVKQFDLTEIEKEHKEWQKSSDYVKGIKTKDVNQDEITDRDLVIYDRWDPYTSEVFEFNLTRGKSSDHQVNMIRMEFSKDTGVKYYDCYSMLASHYFGHEEELKKRAEMQTYFDDPNEFK